MSDKVYIFDTTLRDGEQVPGCQLNTLEKLEVARLLQELGVDVIEAGFPISSPGDFQSVREISKVVSKPTICALTRAREGDIDAAVDALKFAKRKRIHTGIGASDMHIKYKFNSTRKDILEQGVRAVKYAKKFVEDIEFYGEDAGRADNDFLCQMVEAVIAAGATVVNIPDTTGYCLPAEFGAKIKYLFDNVPNINKAIISVHCHNDLGMATANSMAGVMNGARQVEVTINGVGERAGNTSLEEIAMIIKTHQKNIGVHTDINTRKIYPASRLVSRLMRMPVQYNKAIVGKNAFAHSSGIHQHGVLKNRLNYEIIDPKDVGVQSAIILTARSGRAALTHRLEKLGFEIKKTQIDSLYKEFLVLADKKKEVNDEDLKVLMGQKVDNKKGIKLTLLQVTSGYPLTPMATVKLQIDGEEHVATGTGNGPVDAAFQCVNAMVKKKVRLDEFLVQAITGGTDDMGKVHIQITFKGRTYYGFAADTDTIVASVKAYIDALNKII